MVEAWHDEVGLINEATADICSIYKRECAVSNASPWLPVFMIEGARLTAKAATIVVDLMTGEGDKRQQTNELVAIRNTMAKMRGLMVDQFGE